MYSPRRLQIHALLLLSLLLVAGQRTSGVQAQANAVLSSLSQQRVVAAPASSVSMSVSAGYDGYFRPNAWLPVRVTVTNPGPTFSGQLRIDDGAQQGGVTSATPANRTAYTRAILMPEGSTKEFTLYVQGADVGQQIEVILDAPNLPTLRGQAALNTPNLGSLLVGVLSRNPATATQLKGLGQLADVAATVVSLNARTFDDQPLALASLDMLVLSDFTSSELSSDQLAALEDWVRAGGTLVEIGGPTARATVTGLPAALRLIEPGQPIIVKSLPGLSVIGGKGHPLPAGDSIIGSGVQLAGTVVLDQRAMRTVATRASNAPALVVEQRLGLGTVVYSAIDPLLEPLASWSELPRFWNVLGATARSGNATATTMMVGTQQSPNQGNGDLGGEIDNVAAPSITLFVVLLAVYVLVLVPLNFIILQRVRRRDWSWVTLPVLSLLLLAITFGSAYFGRGRNVRISVVSEAFLTSGNARVMLQSYAGLFAPLAGDYTITSDSPRRIGTTLFTPNQGGQSGGSSSLGLEFSQDTGEARLPNMNVWSSRNAAFAGITVYQGGLEGVLRPSGGKLVGVLTNHSQVTLHNVVLAPSGGPFFGPISSIDPGRSVNVSLPVGGSVGQTPQNISDYYGNSAMLIPGAANTLPGSRRVALLGPSRMPLAMLAVQAPLADALPRLLADGDSIPTNPGESLAAHLQRVLAQIFPGTSPNSFGTVVALAWTAQPIANFTVNGDRPNRQDTNLLVQSIPITLARGAFTLPAGSVSAMLAGSDQGLQQFNSFNNGGITIASNSSATFVAQLPMPSPAQGTLAVASLQLSLNVGGAGAAVTPQTASLYNWRTGSWTAVDASNGTVSISKDAQRFISSVGVVRVRVSASDSSISFADAISGVTLGMQGSVR